MERKQENLGTTIKKNNWKGNKKNLGATKRKERITGKETKNLDATTRKETIIGKETRNMGTNKGQGQEKPSAGTLRLRKTRTHNRTRRQTGQG